MKVRFLRSNNKQINMAARTFFDDECIPVLLSTSYGRHTTLTYLLVMLCSGGEGSRLRGLAAVKSKVFLVWENRNKTRVMHHPLTVDIVLLSMFCAPVWVLVRGGGVYS